MEAGFDRNLPTDVRVIAEIGGNHRNDFQTGRLLLRQLQAAGIEWVKFQLWKTEHVWIVPPENVVPPDPAIVNDLLSLARDMNLHTVLSVYDVESLEDAKLDSVDRWKIPAARSGDLKLVEQLAKMDTFISSGYAAPEPFAGQASSFGMTPLVCVSKYPAEGGEYALGTWKGVLGEREWGISDHSPDHGASLGAVALGASWIERHVDFAGGDDFPPTRDRGPHVDSPQGLGELQALAASVAAAVCKTPVLRNPVRRVLPLL